MKTKITYSLLAAAAACSLANAQTTAYTTPVGYVSNVLAPNQFNLVGLSLHEPTIASGVIDAESSSSVTDAEVNFTTLLSAGQTYILELPNGVIQEVTAWSASTLTTPNNITNSVNPGTTTYKLRKAATIGSVFGLTNTAGLTPSTDGDLTTCDLIQIFNGTGFDTIYYFNDGAGTEGWYDDANNPAVDKPIVYSDGIFVKRIGGSNISLVVSGEVKTNPTSGVLASGFNYLNGVAPVGLSLGASTLESFLTPSVDGDLTTCDLVLLPASGGSYTTCYYFNDGAGTTGWYDDANNPAQSFDLSSGFLIFNVGGVKPYTVSVPASYANQ
jgi:hypothetical protein